MTSLSVVVATRDRPYLVADCLRTLVAQRDAPDGFEVVVVDDGSTTDVRATFDAAVDGSTVPVRYLRQEPSGLAAARNRGADAATGELVAYLDDDTFVSPGWAAALVRCHERFGCDALAGRITLALPGPPPGWLTPALRLYLAELDLGEESRLLGADEPGPFGANCAVRRDVFVRVGGFRSDLGRAGVSLLSNEETDFFGRVRAGGGNVVYCADASVVHRVAPERITVDWFRRRVHAQGVSDALMAAGHGRSRVLAREAVRGLRAVPILAKGITTGTGTTGARLWLDYCRGRRRSIGG